MLVPPADVPRHQDPFSTPGTRRTVLAVLASFIAVTALGVAIGFALEALSNRQGATPLDTKVATWFVHHRSETLTTAMRAITTLGGTVVVVGLTAVVLTALVINGRVRLAAFVVVAAVGASTLSTLVKALVDRDRPPLSLHLTHVISSAFPSGHATQAAATYIALGVVATVCLPTRLAFMTWAMAVVVIVTVGVSRLYLGVHWATDVLAGWLLGSAWTGALVLSFRPLGRSGVDSTHIQTEGSGWQHA
jgi:undecaprenyl-diphosphatase